MSSFMGGASGGTAGVGTFAANDTRILPEWFTNSNRHVEPDEPWVLEGFTTGWWPGGGRLDASGGEWHQGIWYDSITEKTSGSNSRLGYQGITRDVNNSPLPGATVKIFLTADDTKVASDIVSDTTTGEYVISTPYYAPHWLKVEKAGSPPVQGVSVNTIYPNV